jgi:hypothetical protein
MPQPAVTATMSVCAGRVNSCAVAGLGEVGGAGGRFGIQQPAVQVLSLMSTWWIPGPARVITASPLPMIEDRARSVHYPGEASTRKSPVRDATTSAVNSSDASSSRT